MLPVLCPLVILLRECFLAKTFGYFGNGIVAESIFDGAVACTRNAVWDIAVLQIWNKSATSFCLLVAAWRSSGILEHSLKSQLIVDGALLVAHAKTFDKGIGNDYLGIRAALCASVAVAASRIWHIAIAFVDVEQGIDNLHFAVRVEQGDERRRRAIGVPDGIEVIVVAVVIAPAGVLTAAIDRHDHGVIESCIEHAFCGFWCRWVEIDTAQEVFPSVDQLLIDGLERPVRNLLKSIGFGFQLTYERDANLEIDRRSIVGKLHECTSLMMRVVLLQGT